MRHCVRCQTAVPQGDERCPHCGEPWRCQVIGFEAFRAARAAQASTSPFREVSAATPSDEGPIGYPAYVLFGGGVRANLTRETRWSRRYQHPERPEFMTLSRFQDGSASLTLKQLREGWPQWDRESRLDLTANWSWLHTQADFPDMLRFVFEVGDPLDWMHIVGTAASSLPTDEAYTRIRDAMLRVPLELSANFVQAIARTGHDSARATINARLQRLVSSTKINDDDPHVDAIGSVAVHCLHHLFALGAAPSAYEETVRRLAYHRASEVRFDCRRQLRGHFQWLDNEP